MASTFPLGPLVLTLSTGADIPALMVVQFSAFAGEPYHEALYPGGNTTAARTAAAFRTEHEWAGDEFVRVVQCSVGGGAVIGYAKWNFYTRERSEVEWRKREKVDWCEGRAKEVAEGFLGATAATRERIWGGRRYALCALLCVHEDYQRKGVGTLLMRWGLDEAERLGLPAYLEASRKGYPLYLKLGFHEIGRVVIKAEVWGGDHDREYVEMLKDCPDKDVQE